MDSGGNILASASQFVTGGSLAWALTWWGWLLVGGLAFFPISRRLFAGSFDGGYAVGKVLWLALAAYGVWLLASLNVAPFDRRTVWGVAALLALPAVYLAWTDRASFSRRMGMWRWVLVEEGLFLAGLLAWALVRSLRPEILDLEKFADFAFVNSALHSPHMPPADLWFAGGTINDHYFGQFLSAFLIRLTGVRAGVGYNLMVASLFAFTLTMGFAVVGSLVWFFRPRQRRGVLGGGLVAGVLLACGGNLHALLYGLVPRALHPVRLAPPAAAYHFSDSTRLIGFDPPTGDKAITEFPAYSFVAGDLHAHVLNLVFVLALLYVLGYAVCGPMARREDASPPPARRDDNDDATDDDDEDADDDETGSGRKEENEDEDTADAEDSQAEDAEDGAAPAAAGGQETDQAAGVSFGRWMLDFVLLQPCVAVIPLLLAVFWLTSNWDYPMYVLLTAGAMYIRNRRIDLPRRQRVVGGLMQMGLIIILSGVLVGPFLVGYDRLDQEVGLVEHRSPLYQLAVLYGYQGAILAGFLLVLWREARQQAGQDARRPWLGRRVVDAVRQAAAPDRLVLLMAACSVLFVILPEVVYVQDFYPRQYARSTTMFRMGYQAYVLATLCAGYGLVRIFAPAPVGRWSVGGRVALELLCVAAMMFLPVALVQNLRSPRTAQATLDGLAWLEDPRSEDGQLIAWLDRHARGGGCILEADGPSYSCAGRISMAAGIPTVLGWQDHEMRWRGVQGGWRERSRDVAAVYRTRDSDQAWHILYRYGVKYLVVGQAERTQFPTLNEAKLRGVGQVVFRAGRSFIVEPFPPMPVSQPASAPGESSPSPPAGVGGVGSTGVPRVCRS